MLKLKRCHETAGSVFLRYVPPLINIFSTLQLDTPLGAVRVCLDGGRKSQKFNGSQPYQLCQPC